MNAWKAIFLGCLKWFPIEYQEELSHKYPLLLFTVESGSSRFAGGEASGGMQAAMMHLWRGDVGAAVALAIEGDFLTADFVSLSVSAGRAAWEAVVQAYAAHLEAQGMPSHDKFYQPGKNNTTISRLRVLKINFAAGCVGSAILHPM